MTTATGAFLAATKWAREIALFGRDQTAVCAAAIDYTRRVLGNVGYHDAARDCASLLAALNKAKGETR